MIGSNLAVAVVMMVVAGFFTVNAVLAIVLLKMVRECKSFTNCLHENNFGLFMFFAVEPFEHCPVIFNVPCRLLSGHTV